MSVREYVVLYLEGSSGNGGTIAGGNAILSSGQHAIDGPEHTGALDLDDLGDVDVTSTPPTDGQALVFDDASDTWVPGDAASALPWYDVTVDGTCVGDGVTDDTVALQAAIDTATNSGTQSATLYFPPGTYLIGGALQDTGAFNAQILLPSVPIYPDTQITLTFKGHARPPLAVHGVLPDPAGYSIIRSTLTGASGTAAVISGGQGPYTVTQNNLEVVVEDLICIVPDNPSMTFWNLVACQGGGFRSVIVSILPWLTASENTHTNAYGVKLPQKANSNYTFVDGLAIGGFYTGLLVGECSQIDGLILGLDLIGIEVPEMFHPALVKYATLAGVQTGIRVTGGDTRIGILVWDTEHYTTGAYPTWQHTVNDLDDPNDYLYGDIGWFGLEIPTLVVDHSFTINGGANVLTHEIGTAPATVTPATTVTDETTWGITPAVGTDTEYARQDHTHGSPAEPSGGGIGPLLLASDHATPIVFDDILQASDGSDFLYASAP